jgi:hypothetical protein
VACSWQLTCWKAVGLLVAAACIIHTLEGGASSPPAAVSFGDTESHCKQLTWACRHCSITVGDLKLQQGHAYCWLLDCRAAVAEPEVPVELRTAASRWRVAGLSDSAALMLGCLMAVFVCIGAGSVPRGAQALLCLHVCLCLARVCAPQA